MAVAVILLTATWFASGIGALRINVGHIGAQHTMRNEEKVLAIAKQELIDEGVLNNDLQFEITSKLACGVSFEGIGMAADMYYTMNVTALIGPYCSEEMDAIGKMASFWNIPIVGYMSTDDYLSNKKIYKTLSRVSIRTTNAIAEAVAALLAHYKWRRVAIVTNEGQLAFTRTLAFEKVFAKRNISVVQKVMFSEYATAAQMASSTLLTKLKDNSRIIICMFSSTRDLTKEFMEAVFDAGMNSVDYAYVLPWLQSGPKDDSPWLGADGLMLQRIKDHFANSLIVDTNTETKTVGQVDDRNGFDENMVTNFIKRIEKGGMTKEDIDLAGIYGYWHLFDALKLFAMALRKAMNASSDPEVYKDGRFIWNQMRRMTYNVQGSGGASGTIIMDDLAERAPAYAAFFVSPHKDTMVTAVEMNPVLLANCDGLVEGSGCFDLVMTDTMTGFWPSSDGELPGDEPACGYRNERCDYTTIVIVGGTLSGLILIGGICFMIYWRWWRNAYLNNMPWRIWRSDVKIYDEQEVKSMLSLNSTGTKLSQLSAGAGIKRHAVVGRNTQATFHCFAQRRPIKFNHFDLNLLAQMKLCLHDNINTFLGLSFNEVSKDEMLIFWGFCGRGTVQDVIYNEDINMDAKFHGAFVRDIVVGLEFLHASPIGYHGLLTTWSCLIDRNWMVRLSDYGISDAIERWEKQNAILIDKDVSAGEKNGLQRTSILYQAPELLRKREENRVRTNNDAWLKQTKTKRMQGDIYSFAFVMHEILFRCLPFNENEDLMEMVEVLRDGSKVVRPVMQRGSQNVHPDLESLIKECWNENPAVRPPVRRVRLATEQLLKTKGSLIDQMMVLMEQYTNNLEKLVQERMGLLDEANERADKLLSQLLPEYVARELKLGHSVPPKMFATATVLFSNIVGFQSICSNSTPIEVVTLLNGVYSGFDTCILINGAYKVETIADAYMVVSGVPEENPSNMKVIADIALEMKQFMTEFRIPHRQLEKLSCRWGFQSGPVAAGVIGLTAPRYCLFGDAVNVASRMESTGLPGMIQTTSSTQEALLERFGVYKFTLRGNVEIKGKGQQVTYWLDGREGSQFNLQKSVSDELVTGIQSYRPMVTKNLPSNGMNRGRPGTAISN